MLKKNARANTPQHQITFEMLTDTGQVDAIEAQIKCPTLLHKQLKTVSIKAWNQITPQGEPTSNYTKILQRPNESYADFLARLKTTISHIVIKEEAKKQLEKLLAYENANQKCQKAIAPIPETGTTIDYLKACHNLRLETQKMQMLAETTTAAFRKKNERCFTYGDKNRLKRDCPRYCKEMHWAKDCKSKFNIERKPIPGNSKQGKP